MNPADYMYLCWRLSWPLLWGLAAVWPEMEKRKKIEKPVVVVLWHSYNAVAKGRL